MPGLLFHDGMVDGNFIPLYLSFKQLIMLLPSALKNLADGQVQTRLPANIFQIKVLKVSLIHLNDMDALPCVLYLIRSLPKLEKLKIKISNYEVDDSNGLSDFLAVQDFPGVFLDHLQVVKLIGITGLSAEMSGINILLENLPKSKLMVIKKRTVFDEKGKQNVTNKGLSISKQLNTFQRASPNAIVIYEDNEDEMKKMMKKEKMEIAKSWR